MNSTVASRVRVEVDLEAIRRNFLIAVGCLGACKPIAVLKANAYGLGVERIAPVLKEAGAVGFAAAELKEALSMLQYNLPVRILGNLLPAEIAPAVANGIQITVTDLQMAKRIEAECARQKRQANVQIAIDSGMGRLGMIAEYAIPEILEIAKLKHLHLQGIFSHCPDATDRNVPFTQKQVQKMVRLINALATEGIHFEEVHMAASDGINNYPEMLQKPFNLGRIGFSLYGYYDNEIQKELGYQPAVAVRSTLVAVRTLPAGYTIGYGRTYTLSQIVRIGTIAGGYADGLPLALSNRGSVLIRGKICPIVGRISMDYATVLLDQVPDAEYGDEVTLLGKQGEAEITPDSWGRLKSSHAYDILCALGPRCDRIYL